MLPPRPITSPMRNPTVWVYVAAQVPAPPFRRLEGGRYGWRRILQGRSARLRAGSRLSPRQPKLLGSVARNRLTRRGAENPTPNPEPDPRGCGARPQKDAACSTLKRRGPSRAAARRPAISPRGAPVATERSAQAAVSSGQTSDQRLPSCTKRRRAIHKPKASRPTTRLARS